MEYSIFVIGGDDDESVLFSVDKDHHLSCRLTCTVRGTLHFAEENDFFAALQSIRRRHLEPLGLIPFCYGASMNVWPSGMSRDMGRGLAAYKCEMGVPAQHIVGIFEEGTDVIPSTVANQEEFAKDWLASFKH